jgi:hypothetical protein
VIDPQALRRLAAGSPVLAIDHRGRPLDIDGLPEELRVPGLLVSPVAEAVKRVEAGRLVADLDRDSMWAVQGFVLGMSVLDGLGNADYSAEELIRAVSSAGFDWQPTLL